MTASGVSTRPGESEAWSVLGARASLIGTHRDEGAIVTDILDFERPPLARHGDHVCGVYRSAAEQRAVATDFVREGLRAGDRVWYFSDFQTPAVVSDFLRDGGVDVDDGVASGQLAVMPSGEWYLAEPPFEPDRTVDGLHSAVDGALAEGWGGFRVLGEMAWAARGVPGSERLVEYEAKVASVFEGRPATALCHYDGRHFAPEALETIARVHTAVARGAPLSDIAAFLRLPDRPGLQLRGEIDLSNRHLLEAELADVARAGSDVHLDLAELDFIDIGGTAVLTRAAETLGAGRTLVLHDPPAVLCRILALSWPEPTNLSVAAS